MNYQFEPIFIGTLAKNQKETDRRSVIYVGDILCTAPHGNVVFDVLNREFYDYIGNKDPFSILYGTTYVYNLSPVLHEELGNDVFRRKTLIDVSTKLNEMGHNIRIPQTEPVKIKKRH